LEGLDGDFGALAVALEPICLNDNVEKPTIVQLKSLYNDEAFIECARLAIRKGMT